MNLDGINTKAVARVNPWEHSPSEYAWGSSQDALEHVSTKVSAWDKTIKDKSASTIGLTRESAAPPAPIPLVGATGSVDGIFFEWRPVNHELCFGYSIYRHNVNAPDSAEHIAFLPQPPQPLPIRLRYDDTIIGPTTPRYYWVASVNEKGIESPRVSFLGAAPRDINNGGGGGDNIFVNCVDVDDPNFNDDNPAAPGGSGGVINEEFVNGQWQTDVTPLCAEALTDVSVYMPLRPDLLFNGQIFATFVNSGASKNVIPSSADALGTEVPMPIGGYLRNPSLFMSNAVGNGQVIKFETVRDTNVIALAANVPPQFPAETFVNSLARAERFQEGGLFRWQTRVTGPTSGTVRSISQEYVTDNLSHVLFGEINTTVAATTTMYATPFTDIIQASGDESRAQFKMPFACSLSRLYLRTSNNQPATGSFELIVRKNGVDTTLKVTVPSSGGTGIYNDAYPSTPVSFAAGDLLSIALKNNATGSTSVPYYWCCICEPDSATLDQGSLMGGGRANLVVLTPGTYYLRWFCDGNGDTTEEAATVIMPRPGLMRNFHLYKLNHATNTGTMVFTVRKNNADTAITVSTSADAAAGFYSDTTNTATFARGDKLSLKLVVGGGSNSSLFFHWEAQLEKV